MSAIRFIMGSSLLTAKPVKNPKKGVRTELVGIVSEYLVGSKKKIAKRKKRGLKALGNKLRFSDFDKQHLKLPNYIEIRYEIG